MCYRSAMSAAHDAHVIRKQSWDAAWKSAHDLIQRQVEEAERAAQERPRPSKPIKAGELLILTLGEYSDFRIVDLFRALADFDLAEIDREQEADWWEDKTTPELIKRGLVEPVTHQEINLGDLT